MDIHEAPNCIKVFRKMKPCSSHSILGAYWTNSKVMPTDTGMEGVDIIPEWERLAIEHDTVVINISGFLNTSSEKGRRIKRSFTNPMTEYVNRNS